MVRGKKKKNNNDARISRVSKRNSNTISSSLTTNRPLIQATFSQIPNTIPLNQSSTSTNQPSTSTNRNTTVNQIMRDSSEEETLRVRNPTKAKRQTENEKIKESFTITGIMISFNLIMRASKIIKNSYLFEFYPSKAVKQYAKRATRTSFMPINQQIT